MDIRHGRAALIVIASLALHGTVFALLALQRGQTAGEVSLAAPFEVSVMPLYVIEPERLRRRRQGSLRPHAPQLHLPSPIAPLYAPAGSGGPGVADHPAPNPPGHRADLALALRRGGLGCDTPDLVGLTAAERERCLERLGAGAKGAAFAGLGLEDGKAQRLDLVGRRKDAYRRYKAGPIPPGLSSSDTAGGMTGLGETPALSEHPR